MRSLRIKLFCILFLNLGLTFSALADKTNQNLANKNLASGREIVMDMSAPPFWMSSYDEFNDLQPPQKEFYLKKLEDALLQVPALKELNAKKLKDASDWYVDWGSLRKKVYAFCLELGEGANAEKKAGQKICDTLADSRIQTLEMHENKKQENRDSSTAEDAFENGEDED